MAIGNCKFVNPDISHIYLAEWQETIIPIHSSNNVIERYEWVDEWFEIKLNTARATFGQEMSTKNSQGIYFNTTISINIPKAENQKWKDLVDFLNCNKYIIVFRDGNGTYFTSGYKWGMQVRSYQLSENQYIISFQELSNNLPTLIDDEYVINYIIPPPVTPSISVTPSITPSISFTPSISVTPSITPSQVFPMTNVNGCYRFEETSGTIYDCTTNNNDFSAYGITYGEVGKINNCIFIPDVDTPFIVSGGTGLFFTTISISCWVKFSGETYDVSGSDRCILQLGENFAFTFYYIGANRALEIQGSTGGPVTSDQIDIQDGNWHHIGVTYDYSTRNTVFYCDGVSVGGGISTSYADYTSSTMMFLGSIEYSIPRTSMRGWIDELGVWNRVLTATEMSALYNGGTGVICCGPDPSPSITPSISTLP